MIDFHCLKHPTRDRGKYLKALEEAFDASPYNFRVLDGIEGRLGEARENGYRLGSCKYVAYIDDDDEVITSGFQSVIDKLEADPSIDAVASREYARSNGDVSKVIYNFNDGDVMPMSELPLAHRLVVRRSTMEKYIGKFTHTNICDFIVRVQIFLGGGKVVHDDSFTQFYNVDESSVAGRYHTYTPYEKEIMRKFISKLKEGT